MLGWLRIRRLSPMAIMIYGGIPSFRKQLVSDVIEPLDPADAEAITEGVIAPRGCTVRG